MANLMDKTLFQQAPLNNQNDVYSVVRQARQNPKAFEDYVKNNNPQAYQQALQIRNSVNNPQQFVMQMAQQRGINPNILRMLDL